MRSHDHHVQRLRAPAVLAFGLALFTVSPASAGAEPQEAPKDQAGIIGVLKGSDSERAKTGTATEHPGGANLPDDKTSPETDGKYGIQCNALSPTAEPSGKYGILCNDRTAKPAPTTGKYGILCDGAPPADNAPPQPVEPRK